ncbi:rhomboid family intramembrane serine protease [Phenylobacterium sp.]|uniref:rhomboid family intramembrane serine protease n=1 Tax=Phenylobacterium sp. TaxID=1871053 RepID=UPI0025E62AC2|nr:rhomboid family intramembrane serine protease [Phenylobacterium sp.]
MSTAYFEAPAPGGSRPPHQGEPDFRPAPEPIVNAPWPVVVLTLSIVAAYLVQSRFPLPLVSEAFAFSPALLLQGHAERLVSSLFVHGNWAHALMNAAFILAFGAPVARYYGPRLGGVVAFFLFYLVCGVLACLGFAAVHWGQEAALVGASGAASGLMGGAARLIGGQGRPGPMFSKAVTGMGTAWIIVNVIMAFTGGALIPGAGSAGVGWEAHLAGFAAGVLLIGPFGWLAGRS